MPRTTPATDVTIMPLHPTHATDCEAIGRALPNWFGIEEGLLDLRHVAETQSGFIATVADEVIGFVTLERHFPESSEITWMAVHPDHHRRGVGRMLIDATLVACHNAGVSFLLVKTLADTHPSPDYAETRAFYERMGFERLQVFPDLWGPDNPCLMLCRVVN